MSKYYFQKGDENCYQLDFHKDYMKENGLRELTLREAKIERGTGYFFCTHFKEIGESNGTCGKECSAYKPRNRKSGICKHSGNVFEQTDKELILKQP